MLVHPSWAPLFPVTYVFPVPPALSLIPCLVICCHLCMHVAFTPQIPCIRENLWYCFSALVCFIWHKIIQVHPCHSKGYNLLFKGWIIFIYVTESLYLSIDTLTVHVSWLVWTLLWWTLGCSSLHRMISLHTLEEALLGRISLIVWLLYEASAGFHGDCTNERPHPLYFRSSFASHL